MANRNNLRATALFTLLLITEAMHSAPMKAAKRELKPMVHRVLKDLRNESICKHKKPAAVHPIACLSELKNDAYDCQHVSIFGMYFTQATDLDIQTLVTEQLQEINQYIQGFQNVLCKSEPEMTACDAIFTKHDGDYEKVCELMSLLELLLQWLSK